MIWGTFWCFRSGAQTIYYNKTSWKLPLCLLKTDPRRKWRKTQSWLKRLECFPVGEVERTFMGNSNSIPQSMMKLDPTLSIFIIPYLWNGSNIAFLPHSAYYCWHNDFSELANVGRWIHVPPLGAFAGDQFKIVGGVCSYSKQVWILVSES